MKIEELKIEEVSEEGRRQPMYVYPYGTLNNPYMALEWAVNSIFTSDEMERQIFCTVIHVLYFERSKTNPSFEFFRETDKPKDMEKTEILHRQYSRFIAQ